MMHRLAFWRFLTPMAVTALLAVGCTDARNSAPNTDDSPQMRHQKRHARIPTGLQPSWKSRNKTQAGRQLMRIGA